MNKTKIKLITVSVLLIFISLGVALGISRALFEDQQMLDTTISMGTLNLKVGDESPANVPLDFENMMPGESRTVSFMVENIGSVEGNFWVRGEIIEEGEGENPHNEPVTALDGDLRECARLSLHRVRDDGLVDTVVNHMLLRNIETEFDAESGSETDIALNNGPVEMRVLVSTQMCGNETMGDFLKANLYLYLTQVVD